MEIELHKEDLVMLGDEIVPFNDCVAITMAGFSSSMVWEREIIIRNVLKLFGEQYKVVGLYGWPNEEAEDECVCHITAFATNLPWDMIEEYMDDEEFHF